MCSLAAGQKIGAFVLPSEPSSCWRSGAYGVLLYLDLFLESRVPAWAYLRL